MFVVQRAHAYLSRTVSTQAPAVHFQATYSQLSYRFNPHAESNNIDRQYESQVLLYAWPAPNLVYLTA